MFVVNFDFSEHLIIKKLLLINLPVLVTQFITYPLQRVQTLFLTQQSFTNNQFYQTNYLIRKMIGTEGFPKLYHGLRYSLDYSMTQLTFKFVFFDILYDNMREQNKWKLYISCFAANLIGTIASQSAFNYQVISSSMDINKNNIDQHVKVKLLKYTSKPVHRIGLKYTIPVSIINTGLELLILRSFQDLYKDNNTNYAMKQYMTAITAFFVTAFPFHYAFQRQVEITLELKHRLNFSRGLFGTILRHVAKFSVLYTFYYLFVQYEARKQIENEHVKRHVHFHTQTARKSSWSVQK